MEVAYSTLIARPTIVKNTHIRGLAKDGVDHPRIVRYRSLTLPGRPIIDLIDRSLGGDHTIVLPILRSLFQVYGPISVIHFDAHLDTWTGYAGQTVTPQSQITHGTFFAIAWEEGLISNASIHAGIRCKLEVADV
jgi:agmatinase